MVSARPRLNIVHATPGIDLKVVFLWSPKSRGGRPNAIITFDTAIFIRGFTRSCSQQVAHIPVKLSIEPWNCDRLARDESYGA